MQSSPILCVFLLNCFADQLSKSTLSVCPDNCNCYSAPKDGHQSGNTAVSLICDKYPDLNQLQQISSLYVNTLSFNNASFKNLDQNLLSHKNVDKLNINNIIFFNCYFVDKAIKLFSNLNILGLKVLTFLSTQIIDNSLVIDWKAISSFSELQAIYFDGFDLSFTDTDLISISTTNILYAYFNNTKLENIDSNLLKSWKTLRMLTIIRNLLKDLKWLDKKLPDLWYLDLRYNKITDLSENLIKYLPKLKKLKLDNNNIRYISGDKITNILIPLNRKLNEFSLSGNTICDPDVNSVYESLSNETRIVAFLIESLNSMRCSLADKICAKGCVDRDCFQPHPVDKNKYIICIKTFDNRLIGEIMDCGTALWNESKYSCASLREIKINT